MPATEYDPEIMKMGMLIPTVLVTQRRISAKEKMIICSQCHE